MTLFCVQLIYCDVKSRLYFASFTVYTRFGTLWYLFSKFQNRFENIFFWKIVSLNHISFKVLFSSCIEDIVYPCRLTGTTTFSFWRSWWRNWYIFLVILFSAVVIYLFLLLYSDLSIFFRPASNFCQCPPL